MRFIVPSWPPCPEPCSRLRSRRRRGRALRRGADPRTPPRRRLAGARPTTHRATGRSDARRPAHAQPPPSSSTTCTAPFRRPDRAARAWCSTQSTYQLQRWLDWLDSHPGGRSSSATCRAASPRRCRAKRVARRGPWARHRRSCEVAARTPRRADRDRPSSRCARPSTDATAEERCESARRSRARLPPDPALCTWRSRSACMEARRLDEAQDGARATRWRWRRDWEAVHFEHGKLWLRADDTERAAGGFAEAARLMPTLLRRVQQPRRGARRARAARRGARRAGAGAAVRPVRPSRFSTTSAPACAISAASTKPKPRSGRSIELAPRVRLRALQPGTHAVSAGAVRRRARRLRGGARRAIRSPDAAPALPRRRWRCAAARRRARRAAYARAGARARATTSAAGLVTRARLAGGAGADAGRD